MKATHPLKMFNAGVVCLFFVKSAKCCRIRRLVGNLDGEINYGVSADVLAELGKNI